MKNSTPVKDKAKKVESFLVMLDSLTSIGFRLKHTKHVSSKGPAGDSYEYLLSGDNGVSVEFTFYPAFGDKGDYIVIYVIDDKTDKDFSLDSWVQKRGTISQQSPFSLSSYSGEFEQQLREFMKFVNSLFSDLELLSVLEGKSWIDVRFNWGESK
ncbi:MAG: hypothetical protein OEZ58_09225 [Gammaproteobacteria bacterium]|nr:hypothetical protein [Gammaproteobacteria bacterium]MDH5729158.1 hypothetical protein [Gammaproteobacteria bacterium]